MKCNKKGCEVLHLENDQPPIPAVCIIPEMRPLSLRATSGDEHRANKLYDMMRAFAARFETAFVLHVLNGLVPLEPEPEASETRYEDLPPHKRHDLWMGVENQLRPYLKDGRRVVCLLTGAQLCGFVKLGFPTTTPLAGRKDMGRRQWLQATLEADNFGVAMLTFGPPVKPLTFNVSPEQEPAFAAK